MHYALFPFAFLSVLSIAERRRKIAEPLLLNNIFCIVIIFFRHNCNIHALGLIVNFHSSNQQSRRHPIFLQRHCKKIGNSNIAVRYCNVRDWQRYLRSLSIKFESLTNGTFMITCKAMMPRKLPKKGEET